MDSSYYFFAENKTRITNRKGLLLWRDYAKTVLNCSLGNASISLNSELVEK